MSHCPSMMLLSMVIKSIVDKLQPLSGGLSEQVKEYRMTYGKVNPQIIQVIPKSSDDVALSLWINLRDHPTWRWMGTNEQRMYLYLQF